MKVRFPEGGQAGATPPYEKLKNTITLIGSIVTILGFIIAVLVFLWTFHNEVVSLTEKIGILEGKLEIVIQQKQDVTSSQRQNVKEKIWK